MNKVLLATSLIVITAACTQEPPKLCDREAIEWNKWGTTDLPPECMPPEVEIKVPYYEDTPDTPTVPNNPSGPDNPSDPDEPDTSKVKGNNGWGNGDDPAPTDTSRERNNAENSDRTHRNHGQGRRD